MQTSHLIFATALHVEAKAILQQTKMKPFSLPGGLRCWQNEDVTLVITGTGKVRSAIATTTILRHVQSQYPTRPQLAVNFGLCGAKSAEAAEIGANVLMHRIRDAGSGRNWFPDILIAHNFAEGPLETHDAVVTDQNDAHLPFVDMEGSGFFEAASNLLGPSHAHCIKVVSDHLTCTRLDRKRVEADLYAAAPAVLEWSLRAAQLLPTPEEALPASEDAWLNETIATLKLSETRGHQLRKAARAWHIRTNQLPSSLTGDLARFSDATKSERLATFQTFMDQFNEA